MQVRACQREAEAEALSLPCTLINILEAQPHTPNLREEWIFPFPPPHPTSRKSDQILEKVHSSLPLIHLYVYAFKIKNE